MYVSLHCLKIAVDETFTILGYDTAVFGCAR